MARRRSPREIGLLALYLGIAVYGAWIGLFFIAWLGFAFAVVELQHEDRRRAVVASFAFLIGGLILVGEAVAWGPLGDVVAAIALISGAVLAGIGALSVVRIGRRGG